MSLKLLQVVVNILWEGILSLLSLHEDLLIMCINQTQKKMVHRHKYTL